MGVSHFDEERASLLLAALNSTSGLGVTLFSPADQLDVDIHYSRGACFELCDKCTRSEDGRIISWPMECTMVHRLASVFADNSGGSYLYICPEDYLFFSAPLVVDSRLVASATLGPVSIENTKDAQEADGEADSQTSLVLKKDEDGIPVRTGEFLQSMASVLSASMFGLGVNGDIERQRGTKNMMSKPYAIDAPLLGLKSAHLKEYPVEFETDLTTAVREANVAAARHALNELLGFLLSSSLVGSRYRFRERIDELVTVVSHTALRAGVSAENMFPAVERCRQELNFINAEDQMCSRLHHFVEQIIEMVQKLYNVDFDDFKYRALSYIHDNYRGRITLDDAADALGFSSSYFSRTFKEHMDCTFVTYVNEVRIQAAKSELISTDRDVAEISSAVGFESVSYFIRVFKREVGMTPGAYRSRRGQLGAASFDDLGALVKH